MAPSVKSNKPSSALCRDTRFNAMVIIGNDTYILKGKNDQFIGRS